MKLSLSWVFDHIKGSSYKQIDVARLFERFNETTAELDYARKTVFDLDTLALGRVTQSTAEQTVLQIPERRKEVKLAARSDAPIGAVLCLKLEQKQYRFATLRDFHADKEGFIPPLSCAEELLSGDWKKTCEEEDYIFCIDNKSISHRPDLWGHRGIAREIAAILDAEMIAEEYFIKPCIIKNYEKKAAASTAMPVAIEIESPALCTRLAGMHIDGITSVPSLPFAAQRLARIDARPIDALVDASNYVMFDAGHPIHTFDASIFDSTHTMTAGAARQGEKLRLLDDEEITLTNNDCVIGNGHKAISLAGIMGGLESSVRKETTRIIVEAAHFNATAVRRTSIRHKKRTEASARFEKDLDPNQNTYALMRFAALLSSWGVAHKPATEIVSVGPLAGERTLHVDRAFILAKTGFSTSSDDIVSALKRLGLGVRLHGRDGNDTFELTIPTFRRDLEIKEDIVEEVARLEGYSHIPHQLPVRTIHPIDNAAAIRVRAIKNHCAFGSGMHEVAHYSLYDEAFLRTLGWQPTRTVELNNPPSQNMYRMITSLIPHLLKDIEINNRETCPLHFFEWGKLWHQTGDSFAERKALGLVWHHPAQALDFYDIKSQLNSLFRLIGAPVLWQARDEKDSDKEPFDGTAHENSLYHPYQTARLVCNNTVIGYAGMVNPLIFKNIASTGDAFIAEIDGEFLASYAKPIPQVAAPAKYPKVSLDVSILAPVNVTVAALEEAIASCDARIRDVVLIDHYQKPEWHDQRSLTFRYEMTDDYKTMEKEEIDEAAGTVIKALEHVGASIR